MIAVNDTTKVVSFPFRPVGFSVPNGKQATVEEIKKWKDKEKPDIILEQSYLTIGGIIAAVLGVVIGFLGFKKDNKLMKWLGGILTIGGISSGGTGFVHDAKLKFDLNKASLIDELKVIINAEDSKKPKLRKDLFEKYKNSDSKYLDNIFSEIFNPKWCGKEPVDKKIKDEAGNLNGMISSYHMLKKAIPYIKDKTIDWRARCNAVSEAAKALIYHEDLNAIKTLTICMEDKSDNYHVRSTALEDLGELGREDFIKTYLKIAYDKTDDDSVRREAIDSISKIKSKKAPETLMSILSDKNIDVEIRKGAIATLFCTLEYLDTEKCFRILQAISEDEIEDVGVRSRAQHEIKSLKLLLKNKNN